MQTPIDALLRDGITPHGPGGAIQVVRDGRIVYRRTFGLADVERKVPITPRTRFRLASLTKAFTAMAVLILTERGKLTLESPLHRFFPQFPAYGRGITVRHLLSHTSGVPDYASHIDPRRTAQLTDRDALAILLRQTAGEFAPGARFEYSNSGYVLLGLIVAAVAKKPFAAFLAEAIFRPLKMDGARFYDAQHPDFPDRAFGHTVEPGGIRRTDQSLTSATHGDGCLYASLDDLLRWDQALYTEKLVSARTLREAFTPARYGAGQRAEYGFGWIVETVRGIRRLSHGGGTVGFRHHYIRLPDKRFSVLVLTNRGDGPASQRANAIARHYVPDLATPRPPLAAVPPETLAAYAGRYDVRGTATRIEARDGRLLWIGIGAKPVELLPLSEDTFFYADDDLNPEHNWRLTFVRDASGGVSHFAYRVDGAEVFQGKRLGP